MKFHTGLQTEISCRATEWKSKWNFLFPNPFLTTNNISLTSPVIITEHEAAGTADNCVAIILDHESTTNSSGHHACRFFRKIIAGQLFHKMWSKLLGTPSGRASKYESVRLYLDKRKVGKERIFNRRITRKPNLSPDCLSHRNLIEISWRIPDGTGDNCAAIIWLVRAMLKLEAMWSPGMWQGRFVTI